MTRIIRGSLNIGRGAVICFWSISQEKNSLYLFLISLIMFPYGIIYRQLLQARIFASSHSVHRLWVLNHKLTRGVGTSQFIVLFYIILPSLLATWNSEPANQILFPSSWISHCFVGLLSSFVEVESIKRHFKSRLVGTVLNGYLCLRKLVVQRTKLIDETQDMLLEMLEDMTTGKATLVL